jgi:hypothetical protein
MHAPIGRSDESTNEPDIPRKYARRQRLLSEALDSAGATAIGRRFQLALAWLATGAVLGAVLPVLGVAVIAAFNAYYRLPIRGESPRPRPSQPRAALAYDTLRVVFVRLTRSKSATCHDSVLPSTA